MSRGVLLAVLLVSAVADAGAQERPPGSPLTEKEAVDKPLIDSRSPMADHRLTAAEEPPPSAYDRARQDNGEPPDTPSLVGQLVKTMFALSIVIAIIWVVFKFGAARLLPGAMGPRDGRIVRIIERILVDQKNSLLVIDVGPDRMLLGVTEGGINVLQKLGASQPPSDTTRGGPAGFRAVLEAISPKKPSEDDHGET
ncbi:MAG: FliO/MopB family protein [Myxococcota bacterium]